MPDFERAFGGFIDRRVYDRTEKTLLAMSRVAFKAGWITAGGKPLQPQKIVGLIKPQRTITLNNE